MKFYTIGYGGRKPQDFTALLKEHGILFIIDVRLYPEYSKMPFYALSKNPNQGIQALLQKEGIVYKSFKELGNPFIKAPDWKKKYIQLLKKSGKEMTQRLKNTIPPFCLLCAEKDPHDCHRFLLANYLEQELGWEAEHIKDKDKEEESSLF